MFKLQRLEVSGFKSFADYTNIVFTGDGITAVVGPNGCGKSNVADAIAWVLGEQRAKQLRGGEMKDVIFQGSKDRAPGGMAEVVLHLVRDEADENEPDIDDIDAALEDIDDHAIDLEAVPQDQQSADTAITIPTAATSEVVAPDNPDQSSVDSTEQKIHAKRHWRRRRLALEFQPGESVSISRRLYRSGESEYLLNGRLCRLRDIQDLFSGTGLSGGHYAIIEQGRIGQILSAKPMDRRTLIEEAAGISKFRVRQRAAEARLEATRGNLSRVNDIISEIERQVNSLRRQAGKAKRYRVLREELRDLLRRVYVAEDRSLLSLIESTNAKLDEATKDERAMLDELSQREEDARSATHDARSFEDELAQARAAVSDSELQRDRRSRERSYQQQQFEGLEKRKVEFEAEMAVIRERLAQVSADCEQLGRQEEAMRVASDETAQVLQMAEAAYAARVSEAADAESVLDRKRAELLTHTAAAERLMEIGRQLEAALDRLGMQAQGLDREGERTRTTLAERIVESEQIQIDIAAARGRSASLTAEREAAVAKVVAGHEAVSETDERLARAREAFSRTRHRLDSLMDLEAKRAYYAPAVQRIFASGSADQFHFMGTLADVLQVKPEWERVVEGAFGSTLQSIIVPTPDDAARAATWLREHDAGRASFLVVGLHGASDEVMVAAVARELIASAIVTARPDEIANVTIGDLLGLPSELRTVLERTHPQKMNARVAATLDDAMAMSLATGEMVVTLAGDWIAGGQFVTAGDERAMEEGAGLLTFKRELRELEAGAAGLSGKVADAEVASKASRARLAELEDAVVLLNEQIGREERDEVGRDLKATQLAQEVERIERHIRVVADDVERLGQERADLEQRRADAMTDATAAEEARVAAIKFVAEATASLTTARREAEVENVNLAEQRAAAAAAAERRRAAATELRRTDAERVDLLSRLERFTREIGEAVSRLDELGRSIEEIDLGTLSVDEERAREEEMIAAAVALLNAAREKADSIAALVTELNHRAAEARESRSKLEIQRAEATTRLSYVREACMSDLNQAVEELASEMVEDSGFELEAGRLQVDEMRNRLENFGAVNMMALEELATNEERLQFLTTQREDILGGIRSTEEALREIKKRSRERFRHAFENVNRNFGELFRELFGGGHGEMSLIDTDDVLESGIEIVAQPPGKRLQNVLLLSGGEKAMAALALTMGIFQYRPSPFCLLDEVDAPLDEANVSRFTNKIKDMAEKTQFIVITHNKQTMEMARALYGVTMQEPGVSKIVSVRFE